MMGLVVLAEIRLRGSEEQRDALIAAAKRLGLTQGDIAWRISRACQDAAGREIARLTTAGPESTEGWQQRCNACRAQRAEECAGCETGRSAAGGG